MDAYEQRKLQQIADGRITDIAQIQRIIRELLGQGIIRHPKQYDKKTDNERFTEYLPKLPRFH